MIFVLVMLFINIVAMCVHITLEDLIARFNVAKIPNTEISDSIEGVSSYNDISYSENIVLLLCRSWKFPSTSSPTSAHRISG